MSGPVTDLAILPLGATEQHGPHLPVDVDTRIAAASVRVLARTLTESGMAATALPAWSFGASGEHQSFPGTVSIGTEALSTALVELGRSVSTWAARLVIVNGHGGNVEALRGAVARLRGEGRDAAWAATRSAESDTDTHAGHAETSLMLALDPDAVRMADAVPGTSRPLGELMPEIRRGGVSAVSPTGILGDPTTATPEEGARLWDAAHRQLARQVTRWDVADDGRLT